jgi:CheY-like chemotaxis protein
VSVTPKLPTAEIQADNPDILVVEDDSALRESLLESLQQTGFVTIAAANGAEALRLAIDRTPRLILLDLDMPVMNGWQFLERRRRQKGLQGIPVIVITALNGAAARDADAQLEKPLDPQQLLAAISRFLPAPAPVEAAPQELPDQPQDTGTVLVIEDDDDTRTAVSELLEDNGYQVTRARNGEEAEKLLRTGGLPDCIVLDLWMPIMNGWSFVSRLRQLGTRAIPILVLTAAEPYWGYPVPAAHVLRKPTHPGSLLALIRKFLAPADRQATSP